MSSRETYCQNCNKPEVGTKFNLLGKQPYRVPCCASCMSNFGHRTQFDANFWTVYMNSPYPWGRNGKKFHYCQK